MLSIGILVVVFHAGIEDSQKKNKQIDPLKLIKRKDGREEKKVSLATCPHLWISQHDLNPTDFIFQTLQ